MQILCSNCNKNKGANRIWFLEPIIFKKNLNNKFEDYTSGMIYMHLSSFYDDELINLNNYGMFKKNQFQIILECIKDVLNDKKMKKLDDHLNALKRLPKPRTRWRRVGFAEWETEY